MPKRKASLNEYSRSRKYQILLNLESSSDETENDVINAEESEEDSFEDDDDSHAIGKRFAVTILSKKNT